MENLEREPCWCCGAPSNGDHHLQPRRFDGPDHPDNLVRLCDPCHLIVDCSRQPTKPMLDRLAKFPKIQLLLTVRVMADQYFEKSSKAIESEILKNAVDVIEKPGDTPALEKLRASVRALKKHRAKKRRRR